MGAIFFSRSQKLPWTIFVIIVLATAVIVYRQYSDPDGVMRRELRNDISAVRNRLGHQTMREIQQKALADMITQYRIVERNGSLIDKYVRAGLVAEMYLQAHDEGNYRAWKKIEKDWAQRAGIRLE